MFQMDKWVEKIMFKIKERLKILNMAELIVQSSDESIIMQSLNLF